jgi:hypothetical protein
MSLLRSVPVFSTVSLVVGLAGCAAPTQEDDDVGSGEAASTASSLQRCEERYEQAAGPFSRHRLNDHYDLFPTVSHPAALLSYNGIRARSYDGTRFANAEGVLNTTVQEVMASPNVDALNAALVYEFLSSADNDADYPDVQLMALQLQPQFPNLPLDWVLYYIVSGNQNWKGKIKLAFCDGPLWTYGKIKDWMASYAIPKFVKNNPDIVVDHALCAEKDEAEGKTLVCDWE